MPKGTEYTNEWSSIQQGYEVMHTPFRFPLKDTVTLRHWLGMVDAFHFCSQAGHTLTVRKEKKQRGTAYWYAYKRIGDKVHKKYLGDTSKLDLPTLEAVARQFSEPEPVAAKQHAQQRQPTVIFTRTLESALRIYGFRSIPNQRELTLKYRELSKKHHPDTGGLHQDMVAVNLAYDYLKKFVNERR